MDNANNTKDRVISELTELNNRADKLDKFIGSSDYYLLNDANHFLLKQQLQVMHTYSTILTERLRLWESATK